MEEITAVHLSKSSRGAASELRAGVYLLEQGWHAFRAVSPACPVDYVAWKPGSNPILVEIKSLVIYHGVPSFTWPTNDAWDLLLLVEPGRVCEVWAPTTRVEATNAVRAMYGAPPAPVRCRRYATEPLTDR
jgi:hypothetical protein